MHKDAKGCNDTNRITSVSKSLCPGVSHQGTMHQQYICLT